MFFKMTVKNLNKLFFFRKKKQGQFLLLMVHVWAHPMLASTGYSRILEISRVKNSVDKVRSFLYFQFLQKFHFILVTFVNYYFSRSDIFKYFEN